ncbi:hypothetical protein B0H11DRAFT_1727254, partial [Mycena galericulata]
AEDSIRRHIDVPVNQPLSLMAIPDPENGEKPRATWRLLLKLAIWGSEEKKLTHKGICEALITRFRWFQERRAEKRWKSHVQYQLSLYREFRRTWRSKKGDYWELDFSNGEGCEYRRGRKGTNFRFRIMETGH